MKSYKDQFVPYIHQLQDEICKSMEEVDGQAKFVEDQWERAGGGGGKTRVIADGRVFEKGGVNTSVVHGELPEMMRNHMNLSEGSFFACGISLVLHPQNPKAPTVHMNVRYFELYREDEVVDAWFGGGMDLTPYYLYEEDAVHFHRTLKEACAEFGPDVYTDYKKKCDDYFFNSHRNEHRGIGGIFFDYLRDQNPMPLEQAFQFTTTIGTQFLPAYFPVIEKRKNLRYDPAHREWQELRRGRYVEFNLIHDRGTLFGLKTNGRIESILMSLPPHVQWKYDHHPSPGSEESKLLEGLQPKNWAELEMIDQS